MTALLEVNDLSVRFRSAPDRLAVDEAAFTLDSGETLAIVGESGSGKTTTVRAILRLLTAPADVTGAATFDGADLLTMSRRRLQALRWTDIALVPQSAMNSLDPVRTVQSQFGEIVRMHTKASRRVVKAQVAEALARVGIDPSRGAAFPHQLSGGQRQRAMIALASVLHPRLLVADEPTTGLDVLVQDQVLASLEAVVRQQGLAAVLVTHDLGVAAEFCDRLVVMKDGRIVEAGLTEAVIGDPQHDYSQSLIAHKKIPPRQPGTDPTLVAAGSADERE